MELQFQTKITANILYDYMLHHTYNSPSGMIGSGIGGTLVVLFFNSGNYLHLIAAVSSVQSVSEIAQADAQHARFPGADLLPSV